MKDDAFCAGLGCRRGCGVGELFELLSSTLRAHGVGIERLDALASIDTKRDEAGLHELARRLNLPLLFFSAQQLAEFEQRLSAPSAVAVRETGVAGVAEASALAAAERDGVAATLLGAKSRSAAATCALARRG